VFHAYACSLYYFTYYVRKIKIFKYVLRNWQFRGFRLSQRCG